MLIKRQTEKMKRSVDLAVGTDEAVDRFRKLVEKRGTRLSRGTVIDIVLNAVLSLSPEQAFHLLEKSRSQFESAKKMLDATNSEDEASYNEAKAICKHWENIIELFEILADDYVKPNPMRKIRMRGRSLVIPESRDWVVVNPDSAPYSTVATIVEVRNGAKYNMPHFVYFENGEMTTREIDRAILTVFPDYQIVLDNKVDIQVDSRGEYINLDEWANAPTPGYFPAQTNNSTTGNPYGVVIIMDAGGEGAEG